MLLRFLLGIYMGAAVLAEQQTDVCEKEGKTGVVALDTKYGVHPKDNAEVKALFDSIKTGTGKETSVAWDKVAIAPDQLPDLFIGMYERLRFDDWACNAAGDTIVFVVRKAGAPWSVTYYVFKKTEILKQAEDAFCKQVVEAYVACNPNNSANVRLIS